MNTPCHSSGLDPAAYTSADIAAKEDVLLWQKAWVFVGFEEQFATKNAFVTSRIGGVPVVVQNMGGQVRAFRNVCTHRFATLQTKRAGCRPLVCPYHGWSYDNSGMPGAIPQSEEFGLSEEDRRVRELASYATDAIGRFRFVRISADGPSLRDWLGEMAEVLEHLSDTFNVPVDEARLPWATNWKIGVESVLEVYHVNTVHPQSFKPFTRPEWEIGTVGPHTSTGKAWLSDGSAKWWDGVAKRMGLKSSTRYPDYDHFTIWPNLAIGCTRGNLMSVQTYDPNGVGRCTLHYRLFMASADKKVSGAVFKAVCDNAGGFNKQVLEEDRLVSEQVQQNLQHVDYRATIGRHERRIVDFHTFWQRMIQDDLP